MQGLDVSITGGEALNRVIQELARVQGSLPGEIFDAVEQETVRLIDLARAKVMSMPTHGSHHTGLFGKIADGVGMVQVIEGDKQSIKVTTSVPEANMAAIPAGLDAGSWRHPLWGNREHWYTQHGAYSWFSQTFADDNHYKDELQAVLESARDRIANAAR